MKINKQNEKLDKENLKAENVKKLLQKPSEQQKSKPTVSKSIDISKKLNQLRSLQKIPPKIDFMDKKHPIQKPPPLFAKPTAKFTSMKINDPFKSESQTNGKNLKGFQFYYHNSKIPCKINHGSISNKLIWESNIDLECYFISN